MAATVDGDERVIAAAQQIVKSLATSKNVAEDMLVILSSFDNRLSTISTTLLNSNSNSSSSSSSSSNAFPNPPPPDALLDAAESLVHRWDSPSSGPLPWDNPDDPSPREYLRAVDHLLSLLEPPASSPSLLDRAESALQLAMSRLEDEFRLLLSSNPLPLDPDSLLGSIRRFSLSFPPSDDDDPDDVDDDDDDRDSSPTAVAAAPSERLRRTRARSLSGDGTSSPVDLVRPEAVEDLREIADRMLRARYEKECCQAYSSVRRDALDECLCVLGVERVSIEEVQRIDWRSLDDRMKKWIQAVRVVVGVLLDGEKLLCDRVFGDAEVVKEVCFVESAKGCVMHLLNFGEAVAIGHRSPEKLFRILDMYDALSEALPDLRALFPEDSREFVCGEAEGILRALGDAARGTFAEFEKAIQREASRKPMQWGEIHPLTRYVMNYSRLLVDYSGTLDSLLNSDGDREDSGGGGDSYDSYSGSMTPLGRGLRLVLSYLEANLEEKSKLYDDGAMQCVFLMNNILYIVQKVKDSELGRLLGDHWVRKRRGQIRQYATRYLRASWMKVISFLRDDGIGSSSGNSVSKVALKERFKNFNLAYEEVYRTQVAWKVPDPQLREELRISISEMVIPAYRSFMGRYGSHLDGRHTAKYIKYTPEDLESHLADLFEGSPGPSSHLRRKLSS